MYGRGAAARLRAAAGAAWAQARSGEWLDRRRIRAYSSILFALNLLAVLYVAAGTWGLVPAGGDAPSTTDFNSFYAAGALARQGAAQLAYDIPAHFAAEKAIYGAGAAILYNWFFYPPPVLLALAPLAALPYPAAFAAWGAAQAAAYLSGAWALLGRAGALVPVVAFPAAAWAFAMGQNSLLTAGLFLWGMALLAKGRPMAAGLCLAFLCYKPHLAALVPVALAAAREWRALAGLCLGGGAVALATLAAFGAGTWEAYASLFASTAVQTFEGGKVPHAYLINPFGGVLLLGGERWAAWSAQAVAAVVAGAAVWTAWARTRRPGARTAVLAAATLLAAPVILWYDFLLAAVCAAGLAADARATGWRPWEKAAIAAAYGFSLVGREVAMASMFPFGPAVSAALLCVAFSRALDSTSEAAQ